MALSQVAKRDLAEFIAANGENYDMYKRFAESRTWHVFSPAYLHKWVNVNRGLIRHYREVHRERMRKLTTLTRENRIKRMEKAVNTLEEEIQNSDDPDRTARLIDTMRKALQHIAQERGEWNTREEDKTPPAWVALIEQMKLRQEQLPEGSYSPVFVIPENVIEGEAVEVAPSSV